MVYKFADFVVELKGLPLEAEERFEVFKSNEKPLTTLEICQEDIDYVLNTLDGKCSYMNAVLTAFLRKFAFWAINKNAFLLHSALIDVNGTGVAFTAPSGTGKTTHMRLWQELLGDEITVINGDKPMVRFYDNEKYPIGYGTPWNGKERLGCNSKTPIKHLCFIERAEKNSCEKLEAKEILELFFKQIFMPKDSASGISQTLKLSNLFLSSINIWKIKCNMDIEAAEIAYNTIFKEK